MNKMFCSLVTIPTLAYLASSLLAANVRGDTMSPGGGASSADGSTIGDPIMRADTDGVDDDGSRPVAFDWDPPGKWSLAERQAWTALRDEMLGYLKDLNTTCGTNIVADFEYESFRGKFIEGERVGLDAYGLAHVQVPISGTENICKIGSKEKGAVAAGIKKIMFAHGRGGKDAKSAITIKGGTLRAVIEPKGEAAGSWQEAIETYVKAHI